MIINHRKPSPSLNQGISRPSPEPFNSHILIVIVFIIYFVLLVLVLPREQVFLPTKYNPPATSKIQLSTEIHDISVSDSPSSFASISTSDNIEKYHLFFYSTSTHRLQLSLPSYVFTFIKLLPLFRDLNAIQSVRLEFFCELWHL